MSCFAGPYNRGIVTSGLVLYYDVNEPVCYSSGRTDIQDLSRNGNAGTLVNGVGYSANNGGSLVFDGINDYVDFYASNLGNTATVEVVCKVSDIASRMIFGWLSYDVFFYAGALGYNTANSDVYGISSSAVSSLGLLNNWKHYVFEMRSDVLATNNKIYINSNIQTLGQQVGTTNTIRGFNSGNGRISGWRNGGYYIPMELGTFKIYNRALSATEIQQNFNVHRDRFGL